MATDHTGHHGVDHAAKLENGNYGGSDLTKQYTISPELFEKVFLAPKTDVVGELRKTFGNPTPIGILGFSVGLFPLSIEFMGWRGSGGSGVATTTASIFFGGVLLFFAGIGEFILGNTYPMLVFFGYGAHFLTFATTFIPWFNAIGFYTPTGNASPINITAPFAAGFGFYPLALAMLSFVFLLGSLRTNAFFVAIFIFATAGYSTACASLWYGAMGDTAYSTTMTVTTGALFFVADLLGWYLLLAQMIAIMELPIPDLPVFDLSNIIKRKPKLA